MRAFSSFDQFEGRAGHLIEAHPVITIGNFDGVHLGHQFLLNELIEWARREKAPSIVVTFRRHPREMLTGEAMPGITTPEHKRRLLLHSGVDAVIMLEFDEGLRNLGAREFLEKTVRDRLGARGLLVGFNNRIGRDGEGTFEVLREIGDTCSVTVRQAKRVEVSGDAVSSSAIRNHIANGDFLWSRKMLGRPYSISGRVVAGDKRGRELGFPTANLRLEGVAQPPRGVYGVRVTWNGERRDAAANIGVRPTVDPERSQPLLEVHLLDFDGDLYEREIDVEFLFRVRDERKFESLDDLKAQLGQDVAEIRRRLKEEEYA